MGRRVTDRQYSFATTPTVNAPRSVFNRSCGIKTTFDSGFLVPIFLDEVLPGDSFSLRCNLFARLITPITPVFDNMTLDTFFFFVPNRRLWDNWQAFMGERENPDDDPSIYQMPMMDSPSGGWTAQSLGCYFGLPILKDIRHSSLPMRGYNWIYNEWFRDQNLIDSVTVNRGDSDDPASDYTVLKRTKRHDYFTSCLPWPQKGPSAPLPLGDTAPVLFPNAKATGVSRSSGTTPPEFGMASETGPLKYVWSDQGPGADDNPVLFSALSGSGDLFWVDPKLHVSQDAMFGSGQAMDGVVTDLSAATAATINELRQAFQIQKMFERDARGGTRYIEIIRSHFGVVSPDARQQRPEYLGGGSAKVLVNPVPQTSETATSVQGNLAAYGTGTITGHGFAKSFTEHGWIIGLMCARADLNYQQGIERMWSRQSKFDFYWPAFSHLGEQSVLSKEIYADGTSADDDVFGYQERYAEYRYKPSRITGLMRSDAPGTLHIWHLAQDFATRPVLGKTFIEEDPPVDRITAVTNEPHFKLDGTISFRCARPIPTRSIPGLIDHF